MILHDNLGFWLDSNRAQALLSGLVALMDLMKSLGAPRESSRSLNASKGLEVMTPPKSHRMAAMWSVKAGSFNHMFAVAAKADYRGLPQGLAKC